MRKIKFRGWNGEKMFMYTSWFTLDRNKTLCFKEPPHNYVDDSDVDYPTRIILMQYTGLQDINGKEIYVSDILSDKWKVEVYQNDEGTFMIKFHTNPNKNKSQSLKKYLLSRERAGTAICEGYRDCIVIGNIYSNPELLK